ncbi:KASH5 protein, partial [Sagittarius serpentarius]|nr:KASH5 protein [Sagittarius serpentarius]
VTGQSSEEGQLRALHRMLDPEAAGTALDLPTFRGIMREWIVSCQQEGSVAGDRGQKAASCVPAGATDSSHLPRGSWLTEDSTSHPCSTEAAGLRRHTKQLAAQNAKLQQDAKSAEELNTRLAEEMAQLKAQLRCSQQALEQATAAAEELEDLKAVVKGLEEENSKLRRQARQLNQRLLAEGHGLRQRIQALAAEMADLEAQLCRCTVLLSSRDVALSQAGWRVEELTVALEEYDTAVQELRLEMMQLRNQLGQMQDAWAM